MLFRVKMQIFLAGSIEIGPKKFNIKTSGNYKSIEEVKRTVVGSDNGTACPSGRYSGCELEG